MRSTTTFAAVALVAYVAPSTAAPIRKPLGSLRPLEGPGPVKPFSKDLLTPTVSDSDASSPPSVTGAPRVDTTLKNQPELLDGVIEARKLKLPTISPEIKKIGKIGGEIAGVVGTGIGIAKNLGHGDSPDDSDDSDSSADASAAPSASAAPAAASSAPDSDDAASRRELEERSIKIPAEVKTGVKAIPKIIGGIGAGVSVCQFFGHCKGGSSGSSSEDTTAASPAGAPGASATEAADTVATATASADTAATTDSSDSVSRRQLEERFKISPKIKSAGHKAGKAAGTAGTLFGLCQTFGGCGADNDDSGSGDTAESAAEPSGAPDTAASATASAADSSASAADSGASSAKREIQHAIRRELVKALLARELDQLD